MPKRKPLKSQKIQKIKYFEQETKTRIGNCIRLLKIIAYQFNRYSIGLAIN